MTDNWEDFERKSKDFENQFLDSPFNNPSLLIRALTRRDKWEKTKNKQLKDNRYFSGLDTIGDILLNFIIIDHFTQDQTLTPEEINKKREFYGNNKILQKFSKEYMSLHNFVIWGDDEEDKKKWDDANTLILADSFEALIGAIYIDKKIICLKKYIEKIKFFERIERMNLMI